MLCLENVSLRRQDKYILKDIDMCFEPGKRYVVLGTNGAGKSSLAYTIMGLTDYRPTEGHIVLDGTDITDFSVFQRASLGITLLWQEPARFQGLTVRQYLSLGGKISVEEKELKEVLSVVGLSPNLYLNRMVDELLSGGERKRIELASVLLLKPKYAIVDEPDSGIDIMSLNMIQDVIQLIQDRGGTPIVITHREEIALSAEEGFLLCNGSIWKKGKASELIEYYKERCDRCEHANAPVTEEGENE